MSDLQVLEFRKECQAMLVGTVTKIQERSPLKFLLARKLISVDPRLIASNPAISYLFQHENTGLIAFTLRCWRLRKNIKTYGEHCNFY